MDSLYVLMIICIDEYVLMINSAFPVFFCNSSGNVWTIRLFYVECSSSVVVFLGSSSVICLRPKHRVGDYDLLDM